MPEEGLTDKSTKIDQNTDSNLILSDQEQEVNPEQQQIINGFFEGIAQESQQKLSILKEKFREIGEESNGEPSMEALKLDMLARIKLTEDIVNQEARGLRAVRNNVLVDIEILGNRIISELCYGRPLKIIGTVRPDGGNEYPTTLRFIFVQNSSFTGKTISIEEEQFLTISPASEIGRKIIEDSLRDRQERRE